VTLFDHKQFLTQQVENNISISFFSLDERFQSMYFFSNIISLRQRLVVADTQGFGAVGFERWQKPDARKQLLCAFFIHFQVVFVIHLFVRLLILLNQRLHYLGIPF